jgi:hypothetical protein
MKLETAERISSNNVTEQELINAFQDDSGRGEYIILSKGEQFYIQAFGINNDSYVMEYREGDGDHHFECVHELSKADVQLAFIKYLKEDDSWKTDFKWSQLKNKPWWSFW